MDKAQLLAMLGLDVSEPAYTPISQLIANGDTGFASLAGSVNSIPYIPKYLGALGIFDYSGELSADVKIEFDGQVINLVKTSAPGSPGQSTVLNARKVVTITAPRIAREVTVLPDEVAKIRALAETQLETPTGRSDRLLRNAVRDIYSTLEYHRLGAVMGKLLDADGAVINDYFAMLGISQPTQDMTFGTTTAGHVPSICDTILNTLEDALGNFAPDMAPPIVLCGRTFWSAFKNHVNVLDAYKYFESNKQKAANGPSNPNRNDLRYADFEFGGLIWRQYRGSYSDSAGTLHQYIPDAEAYVVLQDTAGTYLGLFCPPQDVISQVNMPGIPIVPTIKELDHEGGWDIRIQSNPLHVMTRPKAAIKITSST